MKKLIFVFTFILVVSMLSATIGWSGAIYPNSGSDQTNGNDITMYYQIYKDGVTNDSGQGANISATLYYRLSGETTYQSVAMTYLGDNGNNDEYTGAIPNSYFDSGDTVEFYCEAHDETDDTYSYGTDQNNAGPFDSTAPGTYNIVAVLNQDVTVTFQVDMTYYAGTVGAVSVAGTFNGWTAGTDELTDPDANNIYTGDVLLAAGSNPYIEYKFVNDGNWESIANRSKNIDDTSDTMVLDVVYFNDANPEDYITQAVTVTFQVYMGYEDAASYSGGVSLQGSVAPLDWDPGSTLMSDPEVDDIYSVDVTFPVNSYKYLEYLYAKSSDGGATWSWESYPGKANRSLTIDDSSPSMVIDPPEIINSDATLPVELSAFTAVFAGSTPTIYWTTQSETNNSGWNLYRSQTEDYSQAMNINIELIAGAGTTSEPTNYTYNDQYPVQPGQTYWYWLESVENNGTTENYGPITLNIPGEGGDEQLPQLTKLVGNHPNPFNPETTIEFQIKEGQTGKLTIYNSKGQVLETTTVTPQQTDYTWKGDKYGSGIYFYKLETENFSQIKKMIMLK